MKLVWGMEDDGSLRVLVEVISGQGLVYMKIVLKMNDLVNWKMRLVGEREDDNELLVAVGVIS